MMETNTEGLKIKLFQQEQLDQQRKNVMREKAVDFLFKNFECGSEWLKIEGIKLLFFYRDLPNVEKRLLQYFENSESSCIKSAVSEFLAGTLDVEDILVKRKRQDQIREELRLLKQEIAKEKNIEENDQNITSSYLGLTSLKVSDHKL